ncbi:MAG: aspartyl protease family protein [bacterium]
MKKSSLIIFVFALTLPQSVFSQNTVDAVKSNPTGPGSYKILKEGTGPIRIPFKMHYGKPLMELEINGKKAKLMIDNGVLWDEVWLLGSQLVDELGLKPIEESEIGGTGEGDPTQAYTAKNLTLKFNDIEFYEQPVLVSPPAAGFAEMFPGTDGQLCNTFFKHFIVEFDFVNKEIVLHNPDEFKYTEDGSILDMVADENPSYSIPFSFTLPDGKVYNDRVDIDLGGVYPLKIALNNKHNIPLPSDAKPSRSFGAQGESSEYSGKIISMTIGKFQFDNPTAIFGDEKTSRVHPNNLGVIGLPLFMKFNTIFDYFNNKLYLTPDKNLDTIFKE